MVDPHDRLSVGALIDRIADLREKANAHAHALSHLHGELRVLEAQLADIYRPAEDWE
jgi:hypothetical protein